MSSKKKSHEELVKQINTRVEFADKLYKKMRSERYGMTFCCPLELESINLINDLCNWEDLKVSKLPEEYSKVMLTDPQVGRCTPPAVYNISTGRCEGSANPISTEVPGDIIYTPVLQDNNPQPIQYKNDFWFGIDCPLIFSSFNVDGTGSFTQMGPGHWIQNYNATPSAPVAQQIPGVTEVSLWNALAKGVAGNQNTTWPNYTAKSTFAWITVPSAVTYYIGFACQPSFGFKVNGVTRIDSSSGSMVNTMQTLLNPIYGYQTNNGTPYPSWADNCNPSMMNSLAFTKTITERMFIYPLQLLPGCNYVEITTHATQSGNFQPYDGMLGYMIWNNTSKEIIASTQRSDLTEIASTISKDFTGDPIGSQGGNVLTESTSVVNTVNMANTCPPGSTLVTGTGNACDICLWGTGDGSTLLTCPDGYSEYYAPGSDTLECRINSGPQAACDTETLTISVVNQNGDPWPNYEIIFDGANYTTDDDGTIIIVVEDASINTLHTFDLCECITTSGGCAVQEITITVTDPDLLICVPNEPVCNCVSPSFLSEVFSSPNMIVSFTDANYAAGNIVTSISYTMWWRVVGQTSWQVVSGLTMGANGLISYNFLGFAPGLYEYKIKSICDGEESDWSATNTFVINVPPVPLEACTDPKADNYNPLATIACNECCTYTVYGCTDSTANNYYGSVPANTTLIDDGSCTYPCYYCNTTGSDNTVPGCCDTGAANYNSLATCDDGSCIAILYGCTDPSAANYNSYSGIVEDGSCLWFGCTDPNYQGGINYIGPAGPAASPTGFIDSITGQVLMGHNIDDGSCGEDPT